MLLDELARQQGIKLDKCQHNAAVGRGTLAGKRVLLAKPLTFMNASGESVGKLARYYKARRPSQLSACVGLLINFCFAASSAVPPRVLVRDMKAYELNLGDRGHR